MHDDFRMFGKPRCALRTRARAPGRPISVFHSHRRVSQFFKRADKRRTSVNSLTETLGANHNDQIRSESSDTPVARTTDTDILVPNNRSFKSQCCERQVIDGCWFVPVSFHVFEKTSANAPPKKSSRPTAKHSIPFSPLVVLSLERLKLVLRRERANPLFLLRWSCAFLLSFPSSLLRSRELLLCCLSLSLSVCHSGFCNLYSLFQIIHANKDLLHFCYVFNFFSTFRADHGTSMSFVRRHW